jgi:hypothetical protein
MVPDNKTSTKIDLCKNAYQLLPISFHTYKYRFVQPWLQGEGVIFSKLIAAGQENADFCRKTSPVGQSWLSRPLQSIVFRLAELKIRPKISLDCDDLVTL